MMNLNESGYGVITAGMKGMTFSDTLNAEKTAFQNAVFGDGLVSICRAGRHKTTSFWQHWRNPNLIKTNK